MPEAAEHQAKYRQPDHTRQDRLRGPPSGPFDAVLPNPVGRARIDSPDRKRLRSSARAAALRVAPAGILVQTLRADGLQVARQHAGCGGGAPAPGPHLLQGGQDRFPLKRRPAGEQFIQDGPQCVTIGGGRDLLGLALGLLRRHVAGGAHDGPALGEGLSREFFFQTFGQAEVSHFGNCRLQFAECRFVRAIGHLKDVHWPA